MIRVFVLIVTFALWVPPAPAEAQFLGVYRWQILPFCNVLVLNISQVGLAFEVTGWDDNCGAVARDALYGAMFFNPVGSIGGGITMVEATGRPAHFDLSLNAVTLAGTWRSSDGLSGVLAPR